MPRFEKLRVSLHLPAQGELFESAHLPDNHLSRSDFLRLAFGERRTFLGRGERRVVFTPLLGAPDGFVAGFFAKESPALLMHEDLTEYTAENFELALFVLSTERDQTVWMEYNRGVGSPKSVLEAFFTGVKGNGPLSDWHAFVRYFENPESYWEAVDRNRDRIAKVTFRFVPPNAFEGDALAQKFYTAIQKEAQNESLEETFKAPPGKLQLDGPMMRASAEVAEQGAGEKELYGEKGKLLYSSKKGRVTDEVPEEDMPDVQNPSFLKRVIARLFER